MSVALVARKDFEDVVRSKLLWSILGLFLLLMVIVTAGASTSESVGTSSTAVMTMFVNIGGGLLLPIAAIFVGFLAITGERESGSLRVLFGLSHGRSEVLGGKLVSRLGAIVVVALAAIAVAAGMTLVLFDGLEPGRFVAFAALTVLLALALTAFAVGVSATSSTRYRAMGASIGGYLVFVMFWYPAIAGLHYLLEGDLPGHHLPEWYLLLQYLNPLEAYRQAVMLLTGRNASLLVSWSSVVEDIDPAVTAEAGWMVASNRIEGSLPVYLSEWFAAAVLVAWILVPVAFGYWRFQRADLN